MYLPYIMDVFLKNFFGDILNQVNVFLQKNSSEFILMRVQKEHTEKNNTRSFEDTFSDYVNKYSDVIFNSSDSSYFPTVYEARGKIVFIEQVLTTGKYPPFGIKYHNFSVQDAYGVSTNWDLYRKWEKVKKHLEESSSTKKKSKNQLLE
ncbi:hypothetical protein [Aeromonas jandaei]|uniref:hypothetical protein n=1 Tax=Aeromonas jandaei TaxID=650 RepID=UPI003B9F2707